MQAPNYLLNFRSDCVIASFFTHGSHLADVKVDNDHVVNVVDAYLL